MSNSSNVDVDLFQEPMKGQYKKHHKQLGRPVEKTRKIRQASHQMPFMTIPISIIKAFDLLSVFLNGELYTEPLEVNIMKREIRIRFKSPEELVKRNSNGKEEVREG